VPVVIDFWAPWCGPCRRLAPVLEELTVKAGGRFVLAKVNVDECPQLAERFGVNGIPAVFALRNESIVDHFTGLMPEEQLRQFLARLVPSAAEELVQAAAELEGSDPSAAGEKYRAALAIDSGLDAARVGLARMAIQQPGQEAQVHELLRGIESGALFHEVDRLRQVLQVREFPHSDRDLQEARRAVASSPDSADAYLNLGRTLAARGEYPEALEVLISAAERDRELGRTSVRELMVKVFQILGVRDPVSDSFRDRLSKLIY
jgi:putative thioredoxin